MTFSGTTTYVTRFVQTRTQKDGSYTISLPASTYSRVCAYVPTTNSPCDTAPSGIGFASADNVTVVAGQSNTQDIAIP